MVEGGPRFFFAPVGLVHGHPERATTTPKIHFENSSGGYLGKYMQPASIAAGARRSGSSGSRPRAGPRGNAGAVASVVSSIADARKRGLPGGAGGAGGDGHRSKRQAIAPPRLAMGSGDGVLKAELKEAKKLLKELMSHQQAWPFTKPVDTIKFPDYLDVIKSPMDLSTLKVHLSLIHI